MPPAVLALIAVAAVLHATWNVILKSGGDPLGTATRALAASTALAAPVALAAYLATGAPPIPMAALGLALVSGVLQVVYFVLLAAAYRVGAVSVVYPIARGTAPLLTVGLGLVVLGERPGPVAAAGIGLLGVGILAILQPWRALTARPFARPAWAAPGEATATEVRNATPIRIAVRQARAANRLGLDPAVGFAVATGVAIAAYSAVDSVGARTVAPWLYAALFYPISAVLLVAWTRWVDPRLGPGGGVGSAGRPAPAPWGRATLAGCFSLAAYLLILGAYSVAPLSIVSPLRESAIVLGSAWASFRMGEAVDVRDGIRRTAGAAVVVAGALLIALGG